MSPGKAEVGTGPICIGRSPCKAQHALGAARTCVRALHQEICHRGAAVGVGAGRGELSLCPFCF